MARDLWLVGPLAKVKYGRKPLLNPQHAVLEENVPTVNTAQVPCRLDVTLQWKWSACKYHILLQKLSLCRFQTVCNSHPLESYRSFTRVLSLHKNSFLPLWNKNTKNYNVKNIPKCWKQFRSPTQLQTCLLNPALKSANFTTQGFSLWWEKLHEDYGTGQWERTVPLSLKCLSAKLQSNDKSPHRFFFPPIPLNTHNWIVIDLLSALLMGIINKEKKKNRKESPTVLINTSGCPTPISYIF